MSFKDNLRKANDARNTLIPVIEMEKEKLNVNQNVNSSTEEVDLIDLSSMENESDFLKLFTESKKLTVEETHTRQTFLMKNELKNRLAKLANKQPRGFKHQLLNYALEQVLDEIESYKQVETWNRTDNRGFIDFTFVS